MTTPPFSDFLEVLRVKGFGVGLHEHLALGKLVAAWTGTDRDEFRNAVAALIARHDEDIRAIKGAFDAFYPLSPQTKNGQEGSGPAVVKRFTLVRLVRSKWTWIGVILSIAATTATVIIAVPDPPVLLGTAPAPVNTDPGTTPVSRPNEPAYVTTAFPPAGISPPKSRPAVNWRKVSWLTGGTVLISLMSLWSVGVRRRAREWTADAWRSALGQLPGPFQYDLPLRDLNMHLPRADIEDAAIQLGRSFAHGQFSSELDVSESLRRTLAGGLEPHLVFRARRVQQLIVVLQDVSQSMDVHARRVDGFCSDLVRQGIPLERWYFDGDPAIPAKRPFGVPIRLDALLRLREDAPVMILSAGFGSIAALRQQDRTWLHALRRHSARVWITPVTDSALWPEALTQVLLPVVPLTRAGLLRAATELNHGNDDASSSAGRVRTTVVAVTPLHVRTLHQLASLVPHPTPELLELLRQRFTPDVPESAVLHTVSRRTSYTNLPFHLSDEEIRKELAAIRAEAPALEFAVREYLLEILVASEPPTGSAAHLRWEAAVALHQIQLAELSGRQEPAALARFKHLSEGPLWEEVHRIVERQPSTTSSTGLLRNAISAAERRGPPDYLSGRPAPVRWRPPALRQIAAAALVALVVAGSVSQMSAFRLPISDVQGLFVIEYVGSNDPKRAGEDLYRNAYVQMNTTGDGSARPLSLTIYRNGQVLNRITSDLPETMSKATSPFRLPIDLRGGSFAYQVMLELEGGTSVSNTIWAPSVGVFIDAQPWAKVTVLSKDKTASADPQNTPVVFSLPQGQYQLRLENGGLTQERTESITVSADSARVFNYVMPGFQQDDLVNRLSPQATRRATAPKN